MRERYPNCILHIVETDHAAINGQMSWSNGGDVAGVCNSDGEIIDVGRLHGIWWRRVNSPMVLPPGLAAPAAELVVNDCRATMAGMLLTRFDGAWISDPAATRLAENKLFQLHAAARAGLRTPATLVSQNPVEIREFCTRHPKGVIVKSVRGSPAAPAYTCFVTKEMLEAEDAIRLAPAMYQEYIAGARHLRVHIFGSQCIPVVIRSDEMDWRRDLSRVTVRKISISPALERTLRTVLHALGLSMGIIDLKLDSAGDTVWLEVNPQGQFLFIEGLCGVPLTSAFARFLVGKAPRSVR
ncbi:MAG: ATP-grasp domain-containing protein [Candidatus Deferrimicrobiaceae bacterium]